MADRDLAKREEWQRRMARFRTAGLPVTCFCRDEGVSVPTFYHWRKKLSRLPAMTEPMAAAGFTPVRLIGSPSIAVQLPGGTQLQVPVADPRTVRLVIRTLAQVDAKRVGGEAC